MANNNTDVFLTGLEVKYIRILPCSICIFGVISHVFLIVAFIKDPLKCFKNSGTYLVGNLAISDLLICLVSPLTHYLTSTWCSVMLFAMRVTVGVSILTIAAISIDRFSMTVYPIKYRVLIKGKRIVVWIACIWIILSGISSQVFFHYSIKGLTLQVMNFSAAAAIIFSGVMYGLTYYKLKKQSKNLALENISNRQEQTRMMKEKRFLRTISFIACIQIVCIVPTSIFFNYHRLQALQMDNLSARITLYVLVGLYYFNFAVNPVVYVLRLPNYRKTFYVLYSCKAGK